jgi:NTP pyrophosphatase (non-canonical NTP hydrolase)
MNHGNVCADIDVKKIVTDRPIMHMMDLQLKLQERLGKGHKKEDTFEDIAQKVIYWRHCIHAECDELMEWFEEDNFDQQEVEMEIVDIMHFIFNIAIVTGLASVNIDTVTKHHVQGHDKKVENTMLGSTAKLICILSKYLTQYIDHLPWKSWKTYDPHAVPKLARVLSSFGDIIGAVLNIAAFHGMTMERVVSVYCAKNAENHRRQDNGY